MRKSLVWFRQDLRVADNTALSIACEDNSAAVYALFIATPGQWQEHRMAEVRREFILKHVCALQESLAELNIPLIYLVSDTFAEIPGLIAELAAQHQFSDVYANHEYGWNEKQRDQQVCETLLDQDCDLHLFHDQAMLAPGLTTQTGKPYTVYTPYRKCWLDEWRATRPHLYSRPGQRALPPLIDSMPLPITDPARFEARWPVGEIAAASCLQQFCDQRIEDYKDFRDIPAVAGTSTLSPWLAAGVISPRQCLDAALTINSGRLSGGISGVDTWINELIWRDFYIHILDSYPQVSKHRAFKEKTEAIPWRQADSDFQAWCSGKTGIPIVDAAMRQLVDTGWMHNRLRMIVAMFLSKQLLIDWRRGEQFFMEHLIDGHLASNNGGWQWAASTGTDAVPYFRIFNPVTQSQRFDPDGEFIRRYVPELLSVTTKDIHLPSPQIRETLAPDYPEPIVDLKSARGRALNAFKTL